MPLHGEISNSGRIGNRLSSDHPSWGASAGRPAATTISDSGRIGNRVPPRLAGEGAGGEVPFPAESATDAATNRDFRQKRQPIHDVRQPRQPARRHVRIRRGAPRAPAPANLAHRSRYHRRFALPYGSPLPRGEGSGVRSYPGKIGSVLQSKWFEDISEALAFSGDRVVAGEYGHGGNKRSAASRAHGARLARRYRGAGGGAVRCADAASGRELPHQRAACAPGTDRGDDAGEEGGGALEYGDGAAGQAHRQRDCAGGG